MADTALLGGPSGTVSSLCDLRQRPMQGSTD
jgi:hypothetical protein